MNTNPLYFCLAIPSKRWVQFLKTKKPKHSYNSGNGSTDHSEVITYEGVAKDDRAWQIMNAIGFKFNQGKDTAVWSEYLKIIGEDLNWDFSFPIDEPEIIPLYKVKGVRNIIERTRNMSMNEIESNLDGWQYFVCATVWNWSAIRISSRTQEKYFEKHGWDKTLARINKFRQRLGLDKLKTV